MSQHQKSILLLGLKNPSADAPFDAAALAKMIKSEIVKLEEVGFYAEEALIDDPETYDLAGLRNRLRQRAWTVVSVGFGIRGIPQYTPLFEQIVNTVIDEAHPTPKLVFQTRPNNILEATERVLGKT